MPTELNIRRFKGLRNYYPKSEKDTTELSQAMNIMFDREGVLVSRPGMKHLNELVPPANGSGTALTLGVPLCMWNSHTNNTDYMVFMKSGRIWLSDGVNDWVEASATAVSAYEAVVYDANIYFASGFWYNGTTLVAHPGMPTGKEVISVHKNRLWITTRNNTLVGTEPQRIYFTEYGVPATGAWPAANFIDVRTNTPNRGLISYRDSIYIFKPESVWVLNTGGEPVNWTLRQLGDRGSIGGYCVYGNTLYWVGEDGLFSYNGVEINKLSDAIESHFDEVSIAYDDSCQVVGFDGNLYIQYTLTTGEVVFWIYNITRRAFSQMALPFGNQTGRMLPVLNRAGVVTDKWRPALYFGSGEDATLKGIHKPHLWRLDTDYYGDTDYQDTFQGFDISIETAQMDFGEPHQKKRVHLVTLEGQFNYLYVEQIDEEGRSKRKDFLSLNALYINLLRIPGIGYCRSVRFKFAGGVNPGGVKIFALRAEITTRGKESDDQMGTYNARP